MRKALALSLPLSLIPSVALASELEAKIADMSVKAVLLSTVILLALIGFTALTKKRSTTVFGLITATVLATSTFLISGTIYLNQVSISKGPVHWHADTEYWACGSELQLKDPTGFLSNKIGTSTLHEHNDQRIHLEGVVVTQDDATLGKFMRVIGGDLTSRSMVVPSTEGTKSFVNGQKCDGKDAEVQVFAIKTTPDKFYTVEKLSDPAKYTITDQSNVPSGDCIIFEFDAPKATTDKLCRSYEVALQIDRLKGKK